MRVFQADLLPSAESHLQQHIEPCRADQRHDRRAQGRQHALQHGQLPVLAINAGQQRGNKQRGQDAAEGRDDRARQAGNPQAHEGRAVYRNGAGRHLRDGCQVHELLRRQPMVQVDRLALDQRDRGIAASDGKQADLHEAQEQLQQYHACSPPFRLYSASTTPTAAAARMIQITFTLKKKVAAKAAAITA